MLYLLELWLLKALTFFALIRPCFSLVVVDPCCHVLEHKGALFGPELPASEDDTFFGFNLDRPKISSVEGVLKLPSDNPPLCYPHRIHETDDSLQGMIALIPRGGCSFAEKVYSAQLLGAKAALVFQSEDAGAIHSHGTGISGNDAVLLMAEDSAYAHRVHIPSAFISFNSFQEIHSLLFPQQRNLELSLLDDDTEAEISSPSAKGSFKSPMSAYKHKVKTAISRVSSLVSPGESDELARLSEEVVSDSVIFSELDRMLQEKNVYVVINETGSLPATNSDALPLMWDSMVFLVKVFLIVWSFMAFAFVWNWAKRRIKKYRRENIIRSLPTKPYSLLRKKLHDKDLGKTRRKGKKKYQQVVLEDMPGLSLLEEKDLEAGFRGRSPSMEEAEQQGVEINISFSAQKQQESPLKKRASINSPKKVDSQSSCSSEHDIDMIDSENCVICLSEFEGPDMITVLPCKHIYHKECIEPWLKNKSSLCPMCKASIFKNGESRSLNELNQDNNERTEFEEDDQDEHRRGSLTLSLGMFMVIIFSFSFMMDDNN